MSTNSGSLSAPSSFPPAVFGSSASILSEPVHAEMLIAFFDLTSFTQVAHGVSSPELCRILDEYYGFVSRAVDSAGGITTKFIGDAAMAVFAVEDASRAVRALVQLKVEVDAWGRSRSLPLRLQIKLHRGEVARVHVRVQGVELVDVFGPAVNTAARLESKGLAMTAEAFRSLDAETRTLFKKHTPAISYIPLDQAR